MIKNQDRSKWFGASDAKWICGNWETDSFRQWWLIKLGLATGVPPTKAMLTGTYYEHKLLDLLGIRRKDRQIKIRKYRLRVNLDGETDDTIKEVKTHSKQLGKTPLHYWQQCQIQMFAAKKKCDIIFYKVTEEEYDNYFIPIDADRIVTRHIEYDAEWVNNFLLPRLKYLAMCLKKRKFPLVMEFEGLYG